MCTRDFDGTTDLDPSPYSLPCAVEELCKEDVRTGGGLGNIDVEAVLKLGRKGVATENV